MTVGYFESAFGFDILCNDIASLDENIEMVTVLNHKGRSIEMKVKEGIEMDLTPVKKEMFFMQSVLQTSMNKDQDDEFGRVKCTIFERERSTVFSFEFFNHVILVVSRSISNPMHLKSSISDKIANIKKVELVQ
ncbi:MAG: hypothetical protein D4R72_03365 [Nitrosopumilales archaeon]|nr:MAG: hypothetical protein D4R72_03365 [Nitrosopumilales archaeon]